MWKQRSSPGVEAAGMYALLVDQLVYSLDDLVHYLVSEINIPRRSTGIVKKAYELAKRAHEGQTRKSPPGADFTDFHAVPVAQLSAYCLRHTPEPAIIVPTVAAAVDHDSIEDGYPRVMLQDLDEMLQGYVGQEPVRRMVLAATKYDFGPQYDGGKKKISVYRFIRNILAYPDVIPILISDRAHNCATSDALSPNRQERMALNTKSLYFPLALLFGFKEEARVLSYLADKTYSEALSRKTAGNKHLPQAAHFNLPAFMEV